jgi:hypothetical protein
MQAPTLRQEAAQQRIHELLAELVDVIGPHADGEIDYAPGEAPAGTPTLWEYVVVCCWVDDDHEDWVTVLPAAGMLTHHAADLLSAGLTYGNYEPAGLDGDR